MHAPDTSASHTADGAQSAAHGATSKQQPRKHERSSSTAHDPAPQPQTYTAGKPRVFGRAGELTGNPSSSEPTRFRLPLRFLLVGSEVDRHLSADLSTSKKAKMILDVSHAIAFLLWWPPS
jgi:hypothetical protein